MKRALLWIGPAILLVAITIAISTRLARAQIVFPDGTTQQTAFPGDPAIPVGAAFSQTIFITTGMAPSPIGNFTVPAGKELVILKLLGWNQTLCTIDSRLPSPNQNVGPIILASLIRENAAANTQLNIDFPNGAVVVDAGRQPWIVFRDATTFNAVNWGAGTSTLTVIGYLRSKV